MLDDLKIIHERDAQDALGIIEKQWQQLQYDFDIDLKSGSEIKNIVLGGMGGSALAATLLNTWPGLSVPFEIIRSYILPEYVDENTLFIASSYSGNTEETLATLKGAEARNCQIIVIAAGGALEEIAEKKNYPFFQIPAGFQPRMAIFYNFAALVQMLGSLGLIRAGSGTELHKSADWLSEQISSWIVTVPVKNNYAKEIALELMGKSPVIYAGSLLYPAAYKWKINFNENSKNIAWCNQIPEFNHNEFLGWTSHPTEKPYAIIDLRSSLEHERVQKRFEVTERLLSGRRPSPFVVEVQGETVLQQLLWVITLGDFVSVYLAFLNGLNPSPVDLIEKFKKALDD